MSTPTERSRTLVWAGGLLIQISRDCRLPLELRQQAATVARHYPTTSDLAHVARLCAGDPFGLGEVTPEEMAQWSVDLPHGPLTDVTRVGWPVRTSD